MTHPPATPSTPIRLALGSTNPSKLAAVERAAARLFDEPWVVTTVDVPSGVPDQPWGDAETARGALERATAARAALDADIGLGIESGVVDGPGGHLYVTAWAAAVDRMGRAAFGGSERFALPDAVVAELRRGAELGPLIDAHLGQPGLARRHGAISLLTGGRRDRPGMLTLPTLHALAALRGIGRET